MFVLFDDKVDFRVGKIMSSSAGHLQVQTLHGKQQKIKEKMVLLSWEGELVSANTLMADALLLAKEFEVNFLWETAPDSEFSFVDFAKEYFGQEAALVEKVALLVFLRAHPIYFRRGACGHFRSAPEEQLKAALIGAKKRKLQEDAVAELINTLMAKKLPQAWQADWSKILWEKQSQQTSEQRALASAAKNLGTSPEGLLKACGAFTDWEQFHIKKFIYADFNDDESLTETPSQTLVDRLCGALPEAVINETVFSIDDISTDEIDDALSIEAHDGGYIIGIHIAAPALLWDGTEASINQTVERFAKRLSTVYHPSGKIPMMGARHGKSWVDVLSLDAKKSVPTVSLMIRVDSALAPMSHETLVHRLKIGKNLRLQDIEESFNQAVLQASNLSAGIMPAALKLPENFPEAKALDRLWQFTKKREAERVANGASQRHHNTEYRFEVKKGEVTINKRPRGSPMDMLVAEMMIYANAFWSNMLKHEGVAAIYRVKDEARVGITTLPGRHTTMGLPCYGWFTSPLRRMVDFCNQHQLINVVQGKAAVLRSWNTGDDVPTEIVAPWSSINMQILAERANMIHGIYGEFQDKMERYWCLQWLAQESKKRAANGSEASFEVVLQRQMRYPSLLFNNVPLMAKLAPEAMEKLILSGDSEILVTVLNIDFLGLTVSIMRVYEGT